MPVAVTVVICLIALFSGESAKDYYNEGVGLTTAAAEGPSHTEWTKRAIALQKAKDWQGLLDWSLKWTKSEPENAHAWFSLGGAYSHLNRFNDAVKAYRQAVRIDPEYVDGWCGLGAA
jgi:tetratricopeptide (TPR) repeat protein